MQTAEYKRQYYLDNEEWIQRRHRGYYLKDKQKYKDKSKSYKSNNREKVLEQNRIRLRRVRIEVLFHYSKGKMCCNCCGEKLLEFLGIDHINNNGAEHRRLVFGQNKGGHIYQWLKSQNFPEGFQVYCHNCNLAKGFYGCCPHQKSSNA